MIFIILISYPLKFDLYFKYLIKTIYTYMSIMCINNTIYKYNLTNYVNLILLIMFT